MNILYIPKKTPNSEYAGIDGRMQMGHPIIPPDIIVTDLTPLTKEFLAQFETLKIVATLTTGTDHIDTAYLKERGIRLVTLLDCPGYVNIMSTAEHALGLMIALARNYKRAFAHPEDGRDALRGHELSGKMLGIVGYGRLGKQLTFYTDALWMDYIVYDPYLDSSELESQSDSDGESWKVQRDEITDLFRESDFVSIHAPLNDETRGMITYDLLAIMKPTAYLINTARGELIQEGALLKALVSGTIAGAASDFYDDALLEYSRTHDNLILTPHLGGATYEGLEKADALIAGKLKEIIHEQKEKDKTESKEKA